jgi:hypothetical protein
LMLPASARAGATRVARRRPSSSPKPRLARIMATRLSCVPFTAVGVAEEAFVVLLFPRGFGSTLPALFLVKPGCLQRSAVCPPWRSDEKPNASFLGLRSCGRGIEPSPCVLRRARIQWTRRRRIVVLSSRPLRTSEMTASMGSASPRMVDVSIDMDSMCA